MRSNSQKRFFILFLFGSLFVSSFSAQVLADDKFSETWVKIEKYGKPKLFPHEFSMERVYPPMGRPQPENYKTYRLKFKFGDHVDIDEEVQLKVRTPFCLSYKWTNPESTCEDNNYSIIFIFDVSGTQGMLVLAWLYACGDKWDLEQSLGIYKKKIEKKYSPHR
jgi:hypothetical protein